MSNPLSLPVANSSTGDGIIIHGNVNAAGDFIGRDQIFGYSYQQVIGIIEQFTRVGQSPVWDGRIPYPGLTAFTEYNAALFFGREALIEELVTRVKLARFVAVVGPSGSGKSSLVRAGLLRVLKEGKLPGSQGWLYESLTPHSNPLEQLAQAIAALAIADGKAPTIADELRKADLTLDTLHRLADLLARQSPDQRVVLFVDQFEEFFTQVRDERECHTFLDLLTYAANAQDGRVTVVIALRSDFISHCVAYPKLRTWMNKQLQLVGAMEPDELGRAILLPAMATGVEIEPRLTAQIMTDMWGEPGALPLMQFALSDLFAATQPVKGTPVKLTQQAYFERGGVNEALQRHANAVLTPLTVTQQMTARHIFMQLITPAEGTQDTRRTVSIIDLLGAGGDARQSDYVLQLLAAARLITISGTERNDDGDNLNEVTVTLAHEKLITAWPWLRKLVDEQRDLIKLQNDIADDAKRWNVDQRDASYLYRGALLATVVKQIETRHLMLVGLADEFMQTAIQVANAERRRRQQLLLSSMAGLLIMLYLATAWWRGWTPFLRWQPVAYAPPVAINAVATSDNRFYVASKDYGVKRYVIGEEWSEWKAQGLPRGKLGKVGDPASNVITLYDIAVDPKNPERVYVVADDSDQIHNRVYRSADGGATWEMGGAPVITTTAVAQMPLATGPGFVLLAAKTAGLWGVKDQSEQWKRLSGRNGLPEGSVNAVVASPTGEPYVGMEGLYRGSGNFPWHWEKVGKLEHPVMYIAFGTADRLYLALSTDGERATAVGCYQPDGTLEGKLIEDLGQLTVLTAVVGHPTQPNTYFYGDSFGQTVRAACDGSQRLLGKTSNSFFQGVGDLFLFGAPGVDMLWQANDSGLFVYSIQ